MSTVITEPAVDVCVIGLGVTGGNVATILATNGYTVAGIEKGPYWQYDTDFILTKYDEWGVGYMHKWDHPLWLQSWTWRNNASQFAIPFRRYLPGQGSNPLGHGVGGGAQHYASSYGRYSPFAYTPYSSTVSAYGESYLTNIMPNLDLIDFPVTYDDMVPYYEEFEECFGVTGTNQNPFIPMSSNFPLPPHPLTPLGTLFQTATEALGYSPYPTPTGIASQPFVNKFGVSVNECVYDGYCSGDGCVWQCETGAKSNSAFRTVPAAISSGNFTMALNSYVFRLDSTSSGQIADARYYDAQGNIHVQPATAFFVGLWGWNNDRLPRLSGVGGTPYNPTTATGTLGRGVCSPNGGTTASVSGTINLGANAYPAGNGAGGGYSILDWADNNFDHTGLNFVGGTLVSVGGYAGGGPANLTVASNFSAANIGSAYKASVKNYYLHTTTTSSLSATVPPLPVTDHYHDLDPVYTDLYGDPISRVTTDGTDQNNYNLNTYLTPLLEPILTKMGASNITLHAGATSLAASAHTTGQDGSYHHKGGTRMGASASTSELNMYQQDWAYSNLFITGESAMPYFDGITPGTHAVGPQTFLVGEGIQMYLKSPGELVTSM